MPEQLIEFANHMFVGPLWPASLLVCLLVFFTVLSMFSGLDLDLGTDIDMDLDIDADIDAGVVDSLGGATIKWLNLNNLPIVIWLSIFTVVFWVTSYGFWYGFDVDRYSPTFLTSSLLFLRNGVIGIGLTKMITEPLNRYFEPPPDFGPRDVIGNNCEVSTSQVNDSFGQARFRTDAAPMILNIRTDGEAYPKGTLVQVVAYDNEKRLYKVTAAPEEVST